ncbi:N-6 DNA methylase [Streptosporangium lutulentum]
MPPRGEPELAWVQHGLFHVKAGGHVVVLMPSAAADRRSGRRIRAQLLRTGTLRAVVALPAGAAPHALGSPHLWILRKPEAGDPVPSHVLMVDASDMSWSQMRETVLERWRSYSASAKEADARGADGTPVDGKKTVPLIDLLDETVDLTPARYVASRSADSAGQEFAASLEEMASSVSALQRALEDLRAFTAERDDLPKTTIAEQAKAGAIAIHQSPQQETGSGEIPVLTVEDVIAGRAPGGQTSAAADVVRPGSGSPAGAGKVRSESGDSAAVGLVKLEPGDVVVPAGGRVFVARVVRESGAVLGPGLHLFRADPERVDPDCLASFLRIAGIQTSGRGQTGTSRSDIRRVEIPRLPLQEQRRLGDGFQRLEALEKVVGRLRIRVPPWPDWALRASATEP